RKALADLDNEKRTAGEVAKSLRKDGHAIYAAEIKKVCEEWHHAGFKPKSAGGGMARTFYTSKSNAQVLEDLEKLRKEEARKKSTTIEGFYYEWDHDYSGYRGKKRNFKRVYFFQGAEASKPRNFTFCTKKEYEESDLYDGKAFYGWDEPS